jgi:hypothetical protein
MYPEQDRLFLFTNLGLCPDIDCKTALIKLIALLRKGDCDFFADWASKGSLIDRDAVAGTIS